MRTKLSKGIIQVLYANILNLIIALGTGFIVPKYLSVESYADLKTFLMYVSYVGVLHFGYIDGVYIRYGGKDLNEISTGELIYDRRILIIFQIGISLPIILAAFFLNDLVLIFAAISILPHNMISLYRSVYQATGCYEEYRHILNFTSILIFIGNLLFLFLIRTDNSLCYVGVQVIAYFGVWIFYEHKNKIADVKKHILRKEIWIRIKENIHLGIIIMLGNFMNIWITSLDKWFVKFLCSVADFAYYSFAVSMLKLINTVATAFSVTLYNFFCKEFNREEIAKLRKVILVVGAALVTIIFPLDFFIHIYLEKYIEALSIVRILFAAQFITMVVNSIYLNLYKALNLQKKYFVRMLIITIVAFLLNYIIGSIGNHNVISYSIATLLTSLIWLVLCQVDLPQYKMKYNEWSYILFVLIGYFMCSRLGVWIGMIIYIFWILLITVLLFHKEMQLLFSVLLKIKNERKSKD